MGVGTTYADIPYSSDNNNYIWTNVPITVSGPIDSAYTYKIYYGGTTLNENTVILQGGDSTLYQQFSLKNSGWTINPSTGKAN